jgi:hypothetical protein
MIIDILFEDGFVGIPYAVGHDAPDRHEFVDLREHPEAVDELPEAQRWPEIKEFLVTVNGTSREVAPGTPVGFFTIGCECAGTEGKFPASLTYKITSYVQVAFCNRDCAQAEDAYFALIGRFFRAMQTRPKAEPLRVDFSFEQFGFSDDNYSGHCICVWVSGFGRDEQSTRVIWADGLKAVAGFLEEEAHHPIWQQSLAWRALRSR